MISIDFCENYDFDDTSQNGFCLIASQQFPMPSICFLCGSAGCESLLHCSVCCEPYHSFCLVNCPPFTSDNTNNKEFIWICPKCTNCAACKQGDRQKIYCPKCSNAYHLECFNNKPNGNEKYMVIIIFRLENKFNDVPYFRCVPNVRLAEVVVKTIWSSL